jgi:GR25 family glycosyltransferase involved in LPS biosynthesis|tara:strand:+ start:264 stop:845 length:582 start_codon:yes stop_codon:yes gene_type:complete
MKPEVHMITISGNSISEHYRDLVKPSWEDAGWKVRHFEALVPSDCLSFDALPLGEKQRGKKVVGFTDTEIAVWYSHYYAWMLCRKLNKPIIVAEHDILLEQDIDLDVFNHDIACLSHVTRKNGDHAKLAGGAYYITPVGATRLCAIKDHKRASVNYNSDAWIHRICDKYGKWFMMTTIQVQDEEIGVTVEHRK